MTTNQLKYFISVAECLNFTEAGKKHFISQTAITQHIQALEQQLNVQLFIRSKRHVELTPAGKVFLEEAKAILERMNIALERTEKAANGFSGNLDIGYIKGYEASGFEIFLKSFHFDHPNISFTLKRESQLDLLLHLDQNQLDVAFNACYYPTDLSNFEYRILKRYRLYVVLYPSHPYAKLSIIRRYDLRNENFLLTKFYDDKTASDYTIPGQFGASGFIPKVIGTSTDIETLLLMVASEIGITILPETAIGSFRHNNHLVFIPLEGEHEYIDMILMWKKGNTNPAITTLIESVTDSQ